MIRFKDISKTPALYSSDRIIKTFRYKDIKGRITTYNNFINNFI